MRRRRLYRYAQNREAQAHGYAHPRLVLLPDPPPAPVGYRDPSEYELGVQEGMRLAAMQQGRIVAEAHRKALMAAHQEPFVMMARRSGYDEGYAAGLRATNGNHSPEPPRSSRFTYADVEAARQRGFQEGRASAPSDGGDRIRAKVIDDMLEQCRVIAESNPNMAPGVNAVRHRIKKLAR